VSAHVPVHTRPIDQPQRVGLEVSPGRRVVVAHPVLVEAVRRVIAPLERSLIRLTPLEPLAGEAGGGEGSGGGVDAAERLVSGGPDFHSAGVRREDRAADVVGADEVDDAACDDAPLPSQACSGVRRENRPLDCFLIRLTPPVPDIFADQGAGDFGGVGDPAALAVEDGVDGDRCRRGKDADRLILRTGRGFCRAVAVTTDVRGPDHDHGQPPAPIPSHGGEGEGGAQGGPGR
jgi:hypothetical protein